MPLTAKAGGGGGEGGGGGRGGGGGGYNNEIHDALGDLTSIAFRN